MKAPHGVEVSFCLLEEVSELACRDSGSGNPGDDLLALKTLLPMRVRPVPRTVKIQSDRGSFP